MKSFIKIEIRKFIGNELKHLSKHIGLMFSKNAQALKLSKKALDRRFEEMNKVRAQLDRQVKTFVSLEKYEGEMLAVNKKIDYVTRIVYIGLGVWVVLQIIIVWVLTLIYK